MDNALKILKVNLQEKSFASIEIAQKNWEAYVSKDIESATQIHIDILGAGSEIPILEANKDLLQIRQRTFELAEYCIIVTGDYKFLFKS